MYPLLLALQTAGAALLYWEGLPIYRRTLADPAGYDPATTTLALGACGLIQVAYWTRYRIRPEPPRMTNTVLGHVVLFASRLIFLFPAAIFSVMFISKTLEVQIPVSKYGFIIFALFSLFCYVRDLERLGNALVLVARLADPSKRAF